MICVKYINTMDELKDMLFDQSRHEESGRLRSNVVYRGLPKASYSLVTTLQRNCKELQTTLEKPMLDNFVKYVSLEDSTVKESVWNAMIIGQHYGLPTRLLDWTQSALIALHFANDVINCDSLQKHDCAIWQIDIKELHQLLPKKYRDFLDSKNTNIFSLEMLEEICGGLDEYDADMGNCSMVNMEPPSVDQRIANQYSFFSIVPKGIVDYEAFLDEHTNHSVKYIINKNLRWDIRDLLDTFNVNERMIYPGKQGIAKWIARHYFVRNQNIQ